MTVLLDGPPEVAGNDVLLIGASADPTNQALLRWQQETPLHEFVPDMHRLQLEYWIWTFKDRLAGKTILDIGAQNPRRWLGDGYRTFGNTDDVNQPDVLGDLLDFVRVPHPSTNLRGRILGETIDAIICTEVLEHCENPFKAVEQMHKALVPGGLLLVTSPFLWPDHRTDDYPDLWRFLEQGWRLLLKEFSEVTITPVTWTDESKPLLDLIRRFEGWGFRHFVRGFTGYLCEAVK